MSSKGRSNSAPSGGSSEFYPTPAFPVKRLLEVMPMRGGRWLEPAAGDGAIIRAVDRPDVEWTAVELVAARKPQLLPVARTVVIDSFPALVKRGGLALDGFEVIITNPPFSLAEAFARAVLESKLHRRVIFAMLLRLNWLGSEERAKDFLKRYMPDAFVLPQRPNFDGNGTDSAEYAWFTWTGAMRWPRRRGRISILNLTPLAERLPGVMPEEVQLTLLDKKGVDDGETESLPPRSATARPSEASADGAPGPAPPGPGAAGPEPVPTADGGPHGVGGDG